MTRGHHRTSNILFTNLVKHSKWLRQWFPIFLRELYTFFFHFLLREFWMAVTLCTRRDIWASVIVWWQSTCLACVMLWAPSPTLQKHTYTPHTHKHTSTHTTFHNRTTPEQDSSLSWSSFYKPQSLISFYEYMINLFYCFSFYSIPSTLLKYN